MCLRTVGLYSEKGLRFSAQLEPELTTIVLRRQVSTCSPTCQLYCCLTVALSTYHRRLKHQPVHTTAAVDRVASGRFASQYLVVYSTPFAVNFVVRKVNQQTACQLHTGTYTSLIVYVLSSPSVYSLSSCITLMSVIVRLLSITVCILFTKTTYIFFFIIVIY